MIRDVTMLRGNHVPRRRFPIVALPDLIVRNLQRYALRNLQENKKSFVLINQKGIDPPSLEMLAHEVGDAERNQPKSVLPFLFVEGLQSWIM